MTKRTKWIILGCVVVGGCGLVTSLEEKYEFNFMDVLFGPLVSSETPPSTPIEQKEVKEPQKPQKPDLEVLSSEWVPAGYGFSHISGIVRNNTSHRYKYVEITVPIYDEDGNKLETAWDYVSSLNPGGTWKFEALVMEEGEAFYRESEIEVSGDW